MSGIEEPSVSSDGTTNSSPFAFRLRSLLLLVLVFGILFAVVTYRKKRAGVDELIALLPTARTSGLKFQPYSQNIIDSSGKFLRAVHLIRRNHAEDYAVSELLESLKTSDPGIQRGALILLLHLGGEDLSGREAAIAIARSSAPAENRRLAVQLLGRIAKSDPIALDDLTELIRFDDSRFQTEVIPTLTEEIGKLGPRALPALPVLLARFQKASPSVDTYGNRDCFVRAVGRLGREAHTVIPGLLEIVDDPAEGANLKVDAIKSISNIVLLPDVERANQSRDAIFKSLKPLLPSEKNELLLWHAKYLVGMLERRQATETMIASDRARGGYPRPQPQTGPSAPERRP